MMCEAEVVDNYVEAVLGNPGTVVEVLWPDDKATEDDHLELLKQVSIRILAKNITPYRCYKRKTIYVRGVDL